jgi:hypothetical protein
MMRFRAVAAAAAMASAIAVAPVAHADQFDFVSAVDNAGI